MNIDLAKLDTAIKAVCPIDGVSIGKPSDKATWRVDFKADATPQQKADAQAIVDSFDASAPPKAPTLADQIIANPECLAKLKAALAK